jgi:hypothetical protein
MVAVCDILGFSALLEKQPLENVIDGSIAWFRSALNHSIHKKDFPSSPPPTADLYTHPHVGVAWFSDTVLLYTKQDTDEAIRELLMAVGWLIFETIIQGSTKIRGGISYGEAHIDQENSIYVGLPIVDAYRLEQRQQWAGVALSHAASERVPRFAHTGKYGDWWVTPWEVPLKGGESVSTLAVNWNWGIHAINWAFRWSPQADDPTEDDWLKDPSLCEKFVNTKRFHEAYCQDCARKSKSTYPSSGV